jgi:ABC-type transporter Mla subunit MlaD
MRGRSPLQSLAASPTMVGAITTLIVIVAVFLAYNANQGLPFVPVYRVSVEVPNAARLVNNNEVRIGGHRVGVVESIEVVSAGSGDEANPPPAREAVQEEVPVGAQPEDVIARLNLKLDKSAQPLPRDSVFRVRYRSSFGLKYLEVTRGDGPPAPEGYVFDNPQNFIEQTEFDDINNTFDSETRENSRVNLIGFGTGFAGRGVSLNDAIRNLDPLFSNLRPVTRALSAPETQLGRFFRELGDSARIVAPVATEQAELFGNMAVTFAAISEDPTALQESISEGVPTLETGIETLPRQRPFLRDFTTLSRLLRPGVSDLRPTLPVLNQAIEVGTPILRRTPSMNLELRDTMRALEELVARPSTELTLERLEETFNTAKPLAEHVVPAQTVCNYLNYWGNNISESLTDRDPVGFAHREILVGTPSGQRHISLVGPLEDTAITVPGEAQNTMGGYSGFNADAQSGGEPNPAEEGVFKPYELPILFAPVYGPGGQKGTNADCQGGQTGYPLGQFRVPGQSLSNPAWLASDIPGSRGPTTAFWNAEGDRVLFDSRVASRQPSTWKFTEPIEGP